MRVTSICARPATRTTVPAVARNETRSEQQGSRTDGNVDEEDPFPPEILRQHAAREDAYGGAAAAHCSPDAERLVALRAFVEERRDDRQRRRRDDRGAEPLDCTS